ncbi:GIY-YIG nuclease family protein [Altererythrobacter indicus]|uniref:GIY-YIG nuclease family protein n=1 Tax=Altericroceibacterium indicum TaxID=374177 RepID=A0A845A7J5_9SPHN|nr:GIY-YIG nuclease family protein [Altericroceibacterium indicum]MXP24785.1 GIY-YIG nuclease family protein [Altericroceibacterium indicum]
MKHSDRREALAAYKERKVQAGIYAVCCATTGERWFGKAPDLATIQNRLWFTLRQGSNPHRSLQEAWAKHGADVFSFEVVERFEEKDLKLGRERILKRQLDHWVESSGGRAI